LEIEIPDRRVGELLKYLIERKGQAVTYADRNRAFVVTDRQA
jgi:hypothetical protein